MDYFSTTVDNYRCRGRTGGRPCQNPSLPEVAFERQIEADLRRLALPREAIQWISENIRAKLDVTLSEHAVQRSALENALVDSKREWEALLTLKLRDQVDEETFERRRLGLLDRQAKLSLQLEQPAPTPEALLGRVQEALNFSASLPKAFAEGDAVRRRHIFHAVCANPTVRDRKALYKAKEPFSFLAGADGIQRWYTIVERLRTWIVDRNFQVPALLTGDEEILARKVSSS